MKKQVIIAVGREFGSGGHYVAQKLRSILESLIMTAKSWRKLRKKKMSVLSIWKSTMRKEGKYCFPEM